MMMIIVVTIGMQFFFISTLTALVLSGVATLCLWLPRLADADLSGARAGDRTRGDPAGQPAGLYGQSPY